MRKRNEANIQPSWPNKLDQERKYCIARRSSLYEESRLFISRDGKESQLKHNKPTRIVYVFFVLTIDLLPLFAT